MSTPAKRPSKKGFWIILAVIVGVLLVSNALSSDEGDEPTIPDSTGGSVVSDVHINVTACEIDSAEFATAKVEVTVDLPHDYVGLGGDLTDETGTSIGQGIGGVSNVVAGQTYLTDVIYSLSRRPEGTATCHIRVDSVY